MNESVIETISKKAAEYKEDDTLLKHDMKLLELDTRLRSLENLVNEIHNRYPVWWEEIDSE